MGLPGAGKTHLAERLTKAIDDCAWFNADVIRGAANDWDFSPGGRIRQAQRMKTFSDFEISHGRSVICDFVAPTEQARAEFGADIVVWLNTIEAGRFEDTNAMFEKPTSVDYEVKEFLTDEQILALGVDIKSKIVNNVKWGME